MTMPAATGSPEVRRRRLAAELRTLREARGKNGETVARLLGWSPSKVSRYERARTGMRPREVERLLDYYGVTGPRREFLLSLAADAAAKGWWEEYTADLTDQQQQHIALEHEAAAIDIWAATVVPGLLQTEAYARELIAGYGQVEPVPPGMAARLASIVMIRQDHTLIRAPRPVTVILDEAVLHRQAGDETVMAGQLQRLTADADRDELTLRVLPLTARRAVISESFTLFGFGDAAPEVATAAHLQGGCLIEGERETYQHRIVFGLLADAALPPAASRTLITKAAKKP